MAKWYVSGDLANTLSKHYAVAQWAANHTYATGAIVRQLATPSVGNERCFKVTAGGGGNSGGSEPAWTLTQNGTTSDGALTWTEITGTAANNGDGGGTAWAAPFARLETAWAWAAVADIVYLDGTTPHSQTQSTGSAMSPPVAYNGICYTLSVSTAAVPPTALLAGAVIKITGSVSWNPLFDTTNYNQTYVNGVVFENAGTGTQYMGGAILENCTLKDSGAGGAFSFYSEVQTELINTVYSTANAAASLSIYKTNLIWRDTPNAIQGAAVPTLLFAVIGVNNSLECYGVDFSALNTTLLGAVPNGPGTYKFANCKLHASVTIGAATYYKAVDIDVVNCDSGGNNYREEHYNTAGSVVQDTANYKTGGYSEGGVTAKSWKLTSTTYARLPFPLRTPWTYIWNSAIGSSKTITIDINSSAALKDSDIFLEVESLDSSGSPLSTLHSSAAGTLATLQGTAGTTLTTSSSTWTEGGISTPQHQQLSVTLTPNLAGPFRCRVCLNKTSKTVWVDPKPTVT